MSSGYEVATIRLELHRQLKPNEVVDALGELQTLQVLLKQQFPNWNLVDASVHVEALL